MMEELKKNPWLGLESYKEGEVLYGRDDDIRDLTQSVLNDTDTLLYGKSGIGKSSILNAGILPAARRNGFVPVMVRLSHKGDNSYLKQITDNIVSSVTPQLDIREVVACKDKESESLYEFFHRHTFFTADNERVKLLVIFDQFEEIFTLQSDEVVKKRFFAELADLLNDIMPANLQQSTEVHIEDRQQSTLESNDDFDALFNDIDLGDKNDVLDYVTDNEIHLVFTIREDFLSEFEYYTASIPSLKQNRYGLRPINEEQAAQIILRPMPGLIDETVAKLIIEKVTGRTDFELDGVPEIEVDSAVLSLYLNRLYEAKTEEKITSELVEQKGGEIIDDFYVDAISDISESTVEYLEDMLLNGNGRRDNITVYDAIHDGGVTEQELDTLCNKKKILRQFNYAGDLRIEYVHDILCPVVKEHKEERLNRKQQEEEKQRQMAALNALLSKNRKKLILSIGIPSVLFLLIGLYWILLKMPISNCYAGYTTLNGWPVGLGPKLGDKEKKDMVVHYRLTRKGLLDINPYIKVEVLNRLGQHTTNILVESPLVSLAETEGTDDLSRKFAMLQLRITSWLYTADEEGNVSRQTAYDRNGKVLYSIQYYRESEIDTSHPIQNVWLNYVDAEGKSLRLRSNGADRMRATMKNGYFTRILFFSETGTPQRNSRKAYGYEYEIDPENGSQTAIYSLDEYGDTIPGQSLHFTAWDQYLRWTASANAHAYYGPRHVIFSMEGRVDSLLYDNDGRQIYRSELINQHQLRTFAYDTSGNPTKHQVFRLDKQYGATLEYSVECRYYNNSDTLSEKTQYISDAMVKYRRESYQFMGNTQTITYFGGNDLSSLQAMCKEGEAYSKKTIRTEQNDSTRFVINTYYTTIDGIEKEIRREECLYNHSDDLPLRRIEYEDGKRTLSLEYEIEDNLIVGQHVIGLSGTIIRCPAWDDTHLCYYRKKFIRNFAGEIVAAKAVNEFGEESLITNNSKEIKTSIVPGEAIELEGDNYTTFGIGVFKYSATEVNLEQRVDYLHITDTLGTYYRCGLRDGDILVSPTPTGVKVARILRESAAPAFKVLTFSPEKGEKGMEWYPVYYTDKEMRHLKKSLENK